MRSDREGRETKAMEERGKQSFELKVDGVREPKPHWSSCRPGLIYAVGVLTVISLVIFGYDFYRKVYRENPQFVVNEILISTDEKHVPKQLILDLLEVRKGDNLIQIDLAEKEEILERMSQIKDARLRRNHPDQLVVDVTVREPVAWIVDEETGCGAGRWGGILVDHEGYAIECGNMAATYKELPSIEFSQHVRPGNIVSGERIESRELDRAFVLLDALRELPEEFRLTPSRIELRAHFAMNLVARSGLEVLLSNKNIRGQMLKLHYALSESRVNEWDIHNINLMIDKNIPLILKDSYVAPSPDKQAETRLKSGNVDLY